MFYRDRPKFCLVLPSDWDRSSTGRLAQSGQLADPCICGGSSVAAHCCLGFFCSTRIAPTGTTATTPEGTEPLKTGWDALRRPRLRRFLLASFAQNFALSGLQTNFALLPCSLRFRATAKRRIFTYLWSLSWTLALITDRFKATSNGRS